MFVKAIKKPLYVLINVRAGRGNAISLLTEAAEIWKKHDVDFEVEKTAFSGHALELMSSIKYENYSGFVAASGDGLLHEMINGIMLRPDWKKVIEVPLGILPCGSGNGLASSLFYCQKIPIPNTSEEFVRKAAERIALFETSPISLMFTETVKQSSYAFLNIAWGLPADVDYLSENLRFLSHARFDLASVYFILRRKTYRGALYFIPYGECQLECCSCKVKNWTEDICESEVRTDGSNSVLCADTKEQTSLLPPISEEVPDIWHKCEGNFISFVASIKPLMTSVLYGNPLCGLFSDYITLHMIMDDVSRINVARMFMACRTGNQLNFPRYNWVNVKAFRLVPLCNDSIVMIDGELSDNSKIQAEIISSFAKAFI